MKLTQLWSKANVLASYLLGGGGDYRKVIIQGEGSEELTLPVTPWKYSVKTSQDNKVIDILDFGEALLFGNARLQQLKFSCFFPEQERHEGHKYVVGDKFSPKECIDQLIKWKEAKKPIRVIITDSPVNLMMSIMDFNYSEKDGSRDIWYEISFNEYKELNTPSANNNKAVEDTTGLKSRVGDFNDIIINNVNNQATIVNGRLSQSEGGIPNLLSGGFQAVTNCYGQLTNEVGAAIRGISKARDVLEASKAAYGTFKKLQTLKDANNLLHVGLRAVRQGLQGKAIKI